MHEMSIVEALIEAVTRELHHHDGARVLSVRVRVGALRQVMPQSLEFCYRAAVTGTPLADSRLEIEPISAVARCARCGAEFAVEDNWFECPHCQSTETRLLRGRELELISIELAECASASPG